MRGKSFELALVAMVAILAGLSLSPAQSLPKKLPIPAPEAQARARALIVEIFKEDLDNARQPAARAKLAELFLQQGRDSKDEPANRYVLFEMARDLAARSGNGPLALSAVEELSRSFVIPVLDLKASTLGQAAAHAETKEAGKSLVELVMPLISEAMAADDYDAALKLGAVAEEAARKSKNIPLVSQVQKRNQEIRAVQKGFAHLQTFVDRLKNDPKDAEANFELGSYHAFLKGRWEKGLPLLALGSDAVWKELAARDLANPTSGHDQLTLADRWWELALKQHDPQKLNMQKRARYWYEKAVFNLSGLNRTKAQRRIEQVTSRLEGSVQGGPTGPVAELRKLEGHGMEVKCVAFSPDGRLAVSGGLDQTARIWDLASGKALKVLEGHTMQIWGIAFHPNNHQVFTASWDATVRLWDIHSGNEVRRYAHPKDVNGVAVSRDGRLLLTGCDNHHAYLWNVDTGEELRQLNGFSSYAYAVDLSPDHRYAACGGHDKSLRIYDVADGKQVLAIDGHDNAVTAVAFSPDGRFVFSCGDRAAHQWEVSTGKEIRRFEKHEGQVYGLALSRDGQRLVTGGEDKTVRLWDVPTGRLIHVFKGHTDTINAVAISPNGRQALSASFDRTVRLWGLPTR
jgi:WD40 repeat protein